jgi:hypothetical protein
MHVRFQVLTAASIKFRIVFWDVLPCKIIVYRRFRGTCCLRHQGWYLMMEAALPCKIIFDRRFRGTCLFYTAVHPRRQFWYMYTVFPKYCLLIPRHQMQVSVELYAVEVLRLRRSRLQHWLCRLWTGIDEIKMYKIMPLSKSHPGLSVIGNPNLETYVTAPSLYSKMCGLGVTGSILVMSFCLWLQNDSQRSSGFVPDVKQSRIYGAFPLRPLQFVVIYDGYANTFIFR